MKNLNLKQLIMSSFAVFMMALVVGCSSGGRGVIGKGEPVTIKGVLLNLDTADLVANAKVSVLDNETKYTTETNASGEWTLTVPSGTLFQFVTDDADGATTDLYITLINIDLAHPEINSDVVDLQIHACPNKTGLSFNDGGTVALWNEFLKAGGEDENTYGDTFVPASVEKSSGWLHFIFWQSPVNVSGSKFIPDISVSLADDKEAAAFPIRYVRPKGFGSGDLTIVLNPDTTTKTGTEVDVFADPKMGGFITSFGDPAFKGESVTATITDNDTTRLISFPATIELPVRAGTGTVVFGGSVNRRLSTLEQVFCALGFTTAISCE